MQRLPDFLYDDAGAVTIDWVAITGGILLLGITLVYAIFNSGVSQLTGGVNQKLVGIAIVDPGPAPSFTEESPPGTPGGH